MSKVNKLGQYKGIEVNVEKHIATKEEVEQQVQALVAQNPTLVEKDGEVAHGDITTIDFEGFKDGVAFDGGKAEGHQLEIGSGQFIPGFEDQMIGMKKGETRDLNLTFPEDYGMQDLAGADVVFKVKLHKIENKQESELNDEFVASLNLPNMQTVEDLHKQMEAYIQSQHDQTYRTSVENAIFEKLLDDSDVEVGDEDVEKAMNEHMNHLRNELARQGMTLEQYLQMTGANEDMLRQQLEPAAKQQAKFEAIIDEIVKVENLTTSDEELDQQIEAIANQNQMTVEQVLEQINKEALRHDYNRVKASQLVIQSAQING
ncbi:trigger factor [Longibaculum muris]|uniref:peptidylprolyl isomerase n=1 Tax=Longibaculum muris TaxID=1796628 RepID=A0A4R3ZAS6_9FIRM|nr:trigger factor [Longibaculum muris]KXU39816.1 trigger factor [Candidatus Stoquefichus sp. KLE1796]MBS5368923.1 trigger factor [Coprobacillus cateniformis]MCR1886940.1 trigger factor [Longibaculum muris]TCW02971.1 trigger factor [Longibaculum muris]